MVKKVKTTSHPSQAVACNSYVAIKWKIMIGAMLNQFGRLYAPTGTEDLNKLIDSYMVYSGENIPELGFRFMRLLMIGEEIDMSILLEYFR